MFSPARMKRLDAVLLKEDARKALLVLGSAACVELSDPPSLPGVTPPNKDGRAGAGCAELAARAAALRRTLGTGPAAGGAPAEEMDFEAAALALEELERRADAALKRRARASERHSRLSAETEELMPYAGLPLPSDGLHAFSFLYCAVGEIPSANLAALRGRITDSAVLLPLTGTNGPVQTAVLGKLSDGPVLDAALKISGFRHKAPPSRPGFTLAALAERTAAEERRARTELESAGSEIKALAAEAGERLEAVERALHLEAGLAAAGERLGSTGSAVLIAGWVPAEAAGEARRALAGASNGRCSLETAAPGPGADVPVLLRPPGPLRPFALLVSTYGLPRYGEADPTFFAAAAYLLMFGMMFGDTGHGLVLCAAGIALAGKSRPAKTRDAGRMVFACGLSAAAFGLVYGGFFGLEKFKKFALWRDPLAGDPLALVLSALAAGAVIISLGVALNIANRALAGDRAGAALGRFGAAGLVFYWGGLALAAGFAGAGFALPLMAAAASCWILKEPVLYLLRGGRGAARPAGGDGFAAVAAESLVEAFEAALLYLANTVSFVRLAAYAMSHAALLAAAYALAEAADGAWGRGSAAGILAAAAGNAAAIGLEGLVAGVQALRLEYYEFFGKFLEGGGRPFRPFSLENTEGIK